MVLQASKEGAQMAVLAVPLCDLRRNDLSELGASSNRLIYSLLRCGEIKV